MRAISLWQPHASLIVHRLKPYVTRSWPVPKSLIGQRIWIHAAKSLEDLEELAEYITDRDDGCEHEEQFEAYLNALVSVGFTKIGDLPRGCIVGSAVLRACIPTATLHEPGHFGNFAPG